MGGHEPVRDRVEGLILTATGLRVLGQAPKSSGCVGGLPPAPPGWADQNARGHGPTGGEWAPLGWPAKSVVGVAPWLPHSLPQPALPPPGRYAGLSCRRSSPFLVRDGLAPLGSGPEVPTRQ